MEVQAMTTNTNHQTLTTTLKPNLGPISYKYKNSLSWCAERLNITKRKCNQINKVYLQCDAAGLIVESPELIKPLGKDWRRTLRRLKSEDWVKEVNVSPNYSFYQPCATYWMLNPNYTKLRNEWSVNGGEWLSRCYKTGSLSKYNLH